MVLASVLVVVCMDVDTIILLLATLVGHSVVAYSTVYYIFKRKGQELAEYAKPEKLVPMLVGVMNYRKPKEDGQEDENPTFLEQFCGYLGTNLGRYISGMFGRATRDVNSAALEAAAAGNPMIQAVLNQPGARKLLKNPIIAQFLQPILEGAVNGALSGIPRPPPPGAKP